MTDLERLDVLGKLLRTTNVVISTAATSVQIELPAYDRTAYGWGLREALDDLATVSADIVARALTK
jgi:hypothetical protein